ncbi:hypothetical protein BN1080_00482 [Planococcus massiliensis]|uniref:Uncharacterized protein n=1 Tax=Planococcus massiliensis TaxID=1499687 RepID=A0A098EIE1_9BACL|nr:hypothetical protein BN1080_00482 [Planococcus massiliensis]
MKYILEQGKLFLFSLFIFMRISVYVFDVLPLLEIPDPLASC